MTQQLKETIARTGETWLQVLAQAPAVRERMREILWQAPFQFCGCGTSYFVARTLASLQSKKRGRRGLSAISIAEPGTEFAPQSGWVALFVTRSGTTTEILHAMERARAAGQYVVLISGAAGSPAAALADTEILLDFASDPGVIQARFVTATVLLWRWLTGDDRERQQLDALPGMWDAGSAAIDIERAAGYEHFVTLGADWRYGLAGAASLGLMETTQIPTDYWQPLEYRHGPLSCADSKSLVTFLDAPTADLEALACDIRATGAEVWAPIDLDPLLRIVALQRLACAAADRRGIDADAPRHLVRSVELPG